MGMVPLLALLYTPQLEEVQHRFGDDKSFAACRPAAASTQVPRLQRLQLFVLFFVFFKIFFTVDVVH